MLWGTLITGIIKLKNATDEDIILIQNDLEFGNEVEKVNIKTENGITTIDFCSVNWSSHIDEERINELLENLKPKLTYYAISLYFLDCNSLGCNWYYCDEKGENNV
jgi:hypothetical protein